MDLVITNGTIVTASSISRADIGIKDGKVVQIGGEFDPAARTLDAAGRYLLPGGVDVHTHVDSVSFDTQSADTFETATRAAACGGTTTIIDFCQQEHGGTLAEAVADWDSKSVGKAAIDYGYHIIIVDAPDAVIEELATLPDKGITSFKLFMAYRGMNMIDDVTLLKALDVAKRTGALVMVHAENGDAADYLRDKFVAEGKVEPIYHALSRPPRVEAEATARAIALAEIVGAPIYIVHLTCDEALQELMRAKARGVTALAETCTQYLYLTKEDLARPDFEGAKYVFTPPARSVADQELLWKALADGWLETVSSDHCSWLFKGHKDKGRDDFRKIPNGAPGIEERLMMVYQGVNEGRLSLTQFVDLVATRPSKVFGLFPQKGTIAVGSDADIVLWDPEETFTITQGAMHNAMDYSSYEGRTVKGVPKTVLLRGKVVVEDGRYVGAPGDGSFLKRRKFGA
ncbi:dihydropyrimidinase [Prosthecomicrobium pneumaticum]|uniref:D-hydantoinase n=1 Tax=Prosthecomicrobium pneumaticum TaxID=81895 RepID=A0A7W9CUQ3_9HYPH|nr:dihydropyrimidinase [Prosthecomicrobium pneumaticum]MBB5752240.1 dihydropyrimidinase [Prosthecomicrobium pneumaticum]